MIIKTNFDNNEIVLNIDRIGIIFGSNNSGKTYLLKTLVEGLEGGNDSFEVNNLKVYKGDYKVIFLSDEMNLNNELKLSKSNELRKLIYNDVIEKYVDEGNKLLKELNERINVVDNEVNKFINEKINNQSISTLNLHTNFASMDKIIEKFTDIYVDDISIKENKNSGGSLRELLFQLLILLCNRSQHDHIIFIIDNIESFLSPELISKFVNIIKTIVQEQNNIDFIISSYNGIVYKYVHESNSIYKIINKKLHKLNNIDNTIKHAIILNEYGIIEDGTTIESFYEQNEHLVIDDDIITFKNKYFYPNLEKISLLLVSEKCKLEEKFENLTNNYIIIRNGFEKILFKIISDELGVDNE